MSHLVEDDNISNSDTDENTPLLAENYINDSWNRRLVMVRSWKMIYSSFIIKSEFIVILPNVGIFETSDNFKIMPNSNES